MIVNKTYGGFVMKKKELLALSDLRLDAAVKIQGTDYDRKRKVTSKMVKKMLNMSKKGKSYKDIATKFGVSSLTVRYNLDKEFRSAFNAKRSGAHTGVTTMTFENRVAYKRNLVAKNADVHVVND